jgi:hypothetical protein
MKKVLLIVVLLAAVGTAGMLAYRSMHPEVTDRIVTSGWILPSKPLAGWSSGR